MEMGREQRGRPHEWGDLRKGVCEHVGVPEMGGPAHLWNPLSVWKGWGAQMGRAHANGGCCNATTGVIVRRAFGVLLRRARPYQGPSSVMHKYQVELRSRLV